MGLRHPVWVIHTRYTLYVIREGIIYIISVYDTECVAGVYDSYRVVKTHRMP